MSKWQTEGPGTLDNADQAPRGGSGHVPSSTTNVGSPLVTPRFHVVRDRRRFEYLVGRAAEVGSRRAVARAVAAAALAAGDHAAERPGMLPVASAVARAGDVPRRVFALLRPPGGGRGRYLAILPAALTVGSIVWTGEAMYDLHELLRLARVTTR